MVTTKRSENAGSFYNQGNSAVGLLERPVATNESVAQAPARQENLDQARENMRRNLDMLLNYDRVDASTAVVAEPQEEQVQLNVALQEDDIRPTGTTMQFGDVDIDQVRAEMKTQETEQKRYHLSGKGKIAVVLYSLFVVVMLALIVINAGLIPSYDNGISNAKATLNDRVAQYQELNAQIDSVSSNEYVIEQATSDLGMVKR